MTTKLDRHGHGDPLEVINFGGDPDPRADSISLFMFFHHCGIENFWIFLSISHTINGRFVPYSAK